MLLRQSRQGALTEQAAETAGVVNPLIKPG